jgi:hypothetical protein
MSSGNRSRAAGAGSGSLMTAIRKPVASIQIAGSGERSPQAERSRRAELGDFLKARRAGLQPEDVGLPPGPRRRTPGLRREEVALLAGVGVSCIRRTRAQRALLTVILHRLNTGAPGGWPFSPWLCARRALRRPAGDGCCRIR